MVARIAGFVTRAQAGLVAPRSVSRRIDGDAGLTLHYGGSGKAPTTHAGCLATWRSWQRYHMQTHGWVDIAYSQGFCQHGVVFAGRGFGVRTAANGTNAGNQQSHAACWIGGAGSVPTQAALDAADWLIAETRRLGGSTRVWAHSDWKSTACPGTQLRTHAHSRDRSPILTPEGDDMPTIDEIRDVIRGEMGHALPDGVSVGRAIRRIHDHSSEAVVNTRRLIAEVAGLEAALELVVSASGQPLSSDQVRVAAQEGATAALNRLGAALQEGPR